MQPEWEVKVRTSGIVILVIVLLVLVLLLGGGSMMMGLGMGPYMVGRFGMMQPFGFGLPIIGGLLMLVIWAIIIGGILWLVFGPARGSAANTVMGPGAPAQTPLDILKLRYAKGEITKEQYDDMKRDLRVATLAR